MSRIFEKTGRAREIEDYPPVMQARDIQEMLNVCEAVAGSIINFVFLEINGSGLVRIRYEYSYQKGAFYYGYSKGAIKTNHFRKRH